MPRFTRGDVSGSVSDETAALLGPDYVIEDDDQKAPAKKAAAKKSTSK